MKSFMMVATLVALTFAGCLGSNDEAETNTGNEAVMAGAHDVTTLLEQGYNTSLPWSQTLEAGPYDILESQSIDILVDLPATEGGAAIDPANPPRINMGLFMPDVPEGTVVPVIADIGPYYDDGDVVADSRDSGRLGEFLISNFVPHGYAVAQVSVFGSGSSNHCFDMMGDAEQAGVHAAVEYLGSQDWSNGRVGLIGRSYDGSTPWQAAAMGSEYLETIVPISGLTGIPELMFNNGAPELRTLLFHNVVYGTFGIDSPSALNPGSEGEPVSPENLDVEDIHTLCPDYLTSSAHQPLGALAEASAGTPYMEERRFFERAKQNYDGSVYLIHGLQDWNVDPHAAMPYYQDMMDTWETKGLFGQWDHAYPDRPSDHSDLTTGFGLEAGTATVRYDWAQDLLLWFNHYLMEEGPKPLLVSEIQDHLGNWRLESEYPNYENATVLELDGPIVQIQPLSGTHRYEFPAISEEDVIISGMPVLTAKVTPFEPRGQIYVHMETLDGLRIGTGVMDLRIQGPVVPGLPMDAELLMEAMEAYIPAGEGFALEISSSGGDYLVSGNLLPMQFEPSSSSIEFHMRPASEAAFFEPIPWATEE